MSKIIKQMEMDALKQSFGSARDFVFLSIVGINAQADNLFRRNLRKKKVRLQVVKNTLARRVFDELGIKIDKDSPYWAGNTVMAWGANSVAELSRTLDSELKDLVKKNATLKDKVKFKGAITEGQTVAFELALKLPTREEAIGTILGMILSPGSQIASQLTAAASQVASQIDSIAKREPPAGEAPAAEPGAAAPATGEPPAAPPAPAAG